MQNPHYLLFRNNERAQHRIRTEAKACCLTAGEGLLKGQSGKLPKEEEENVS